MPQNSPADQAAAYVTDSAALARVEGAEAYLRQLTGKTPELTLRWLETITEALRAKLRDRGLA